MTPDKSLFVPARIGHTEAGGESKWMQKSYTKTYGEVEGLVTMLMAACDDMGMNDTLEMILSAPNDRRRAVVRELLERFRLSGAPKSLHEAFVCLLDDAVAEQCKRKPSAT